MPRLLTGIAVLLVACGAVRGDEISFRNDVMAAISKAGCNQGTCHGNANGKGGLKLSLRGDDPDGDFDILTRSSLGRRISLGDPAASLLLRKATMEIPHEGGRRFTANAPEYRILHDWIAQGAKRDAEQAMLVRDIHVSPRDVVLISPPDAAQHQWQQQLTVTATLADGSQRDVTRLAVFEPSQPVVEITPEGLVTAQRAGEVQIGIRLGGLVGRQESVRLAFVVDLPLDESAFPAVRNRIDEFVFDKLRQVRIPASPVCDDTTFVRRLYLDLLGLLPTAEEARAFVESSAPDKRSQLIDRLLARPEFAQNWALKWADLLRVEEKTLDRKGVENLHAWLRHQFSINRPLDEMCHELVNGRGSTYSSPASNYYRAMRDPVMRAESTAQVMLGVRLQCAKCHNHPFDKWKQDDYYGWTSLFAKVDYKVLENNRRDDNDKHEFIGEQIVYLSTKGKVEDPRTGEPAPPLMLAEPEPLDKGADPLAELAAWLTTADNPFFARMQTNRIWYQMMGRGIVDPIDDFRLTNSPSHPELLDWLTQDFVDHGFDLQRMVRLIANSSTYQLSADVSPLNAADELNYSHAVVRRVSAEQLLDGMSQVTGVSLQFNGYPEGMRAGEIPGVEAVRRRDASASSSEKFLTLFGKPKRLQSCECERTTQPSLAQTFQLISGPLLDELLTDDQNTLARLLREGTRPEEIIESLYWSALSRAPTSEERSAHNRQLQQTQPRVYLEDVLWGLVNSNEFLFRP